MGTKVKVKPKAKKEAKHPTLPQGCLSLLSKQQIGFAIGVSVRTLEGMIASGDFPPADTRVGAFPRWRVETLNAWIDGRCGLKG